MQQPPQNIQDRTFEFACRIVELYAEIIDRSGRWRPLATQLLRSGTSIGANLEEASAAHTKPEFAAKCAIARKETRETGYWLRLFVACRIVENQRATFLQQETREILAITTTIIKKARASSSRG